MRAFDNFLKEHVARNFLTCDEADRLQRAVANAATPDGKKRVIMDLLVLLTGRLQAATTEIKRQAAYRSN